MNRWTRKTQDDKKKKERKAKETIGKVYTSVNKKNI